MQYNLKITACIYARINKILETLQESNSTYRLFRFVYSRATPASVAKRNYTKALIRLRFSYLMVRLCIKVCVTGHL